MSTKIKKDKIGIAKKLTLIILGVVSFTGVIGAFMPVMFNMAGYSEFIRALSVFYVPIIASIGYNSAVDKKTPVGSSAIKDSKMVKDNETCGTK